jgi:hypothetical protein
MGEHYGVDEAPGSSSGAVHVLTDTSPPVMALPIRSVLYTLLVALSAAAQDTSHIKYVHVIQVRWMLALLSSSLT